MIIWFKRNLIFPLQLVLGGKSQYGTLRIIAYLVWAIVPKEAWEAPALFSMREREQQGGGALALPTSPPPPHPPLKIRCLQSTKAYHKTGILQCRRKVGNNNLPMPSSQCLPNNGDVQEQLKPFTKSIHVPPFRHGLLEHSSMSTSDWPIEKKQKPKVTV